MRSSVDRVLRLVISQYSAIEYVTRVKRAMRSSRGRRGLGSMWQFHNRGTLASSVYAFLRLFVKINWRRSAFMSFCSAKSLLKKSARFWSRMKRSTANQSRAPDH